MKGDTSPVLSASVGIVGGLIFGYSTSIISTALDFINIYFKITSQLVQGIVTSSILFGAMIGSLLGGICAARFGRKITIYVACGLCTFGTITCAISPDLWLLLVLRVILGIGVGLTGVVCPMFVAETAPAEKKGMFGAMFQLSLTFGILLSFLIGFSFTYVQDINLNWRLMIGFGIVFPLLLAFIAACFINEDTRSFKRAQGVEEARELTSTISVQTSSGWKGLFSAEHRKELITGIILAASLQLTGINAVMYYGPTIIQQAGLNEKFLLNILIGGWNFIATFIAVFFVERMGRRFLMIGGTVVMSVALIGIGVAFKVATNTGLGIAVAIGLFFFLGGFEGGVGCLFWVLVNEVFPTNVREAGGSFTNILQWGFNLLVSGLFKLEAQAIGWDWTFFIFGGIGILCTVYLFFTLPSDPKKDHEIQ